MIIRIKETARKKKRWSIYRLATELNLPKQTVYSWANGRTQPNYQNMDRLCTILGCTLDDLFKPEEVSPCMDKGIWNPSLGEYED